MRTPISAIAPSLRTMEWGRFANQKILHLGTRVGQEASLHAATYLRSMAGFSMKHARCGDRAMLRPVAREGNRYFAMGTRLLVQGKRPSGYRGASAIAGRDRRKLEVGRRQTAAPVHDSTVN